jgi:hypothetical protein
MTDPDPRPQSATSLGPDEPLSDELCTYLLSLVRDGRGVHPRLVERAELWADEHPACRQTLGDFAVIGELLGDEAPRHASAEFTERVLSEQRRVRKAGDVLPLLRRLSIAAALLLGLTLAFDMSFPADAAADDEVARQPHQIDKLRPDPFSGPDLDAGLLALLPDATPLSGSWNAREAPVGEEGADR